MPGCRIHINLFLVEGTCAIHNYIIYYIIYIYIYVYYILCIYYINYIYIIYICKIHIMIEKERDKWQPRLQGHDPGIASVDHQDLDSWSWGMVVFHGSSMGISWSENEEFHGNPPKNHQKYQNNGEAEKKPPPFFRTPNCLGLIFSDLMMNSWGDDAIWIRDGFETLFRYDSREWTFTSANYFDVKTWAPGF